MNTKDYFKFKTDKSVVFVGKTATIKISKRFQNYKLLEIKDTIKTLGIFDMEVDGNTVGMMLPAVIEMCPSETKFMTEGSDDYVICTFNHGDTFIKDRRVVKDPHLAYVLFSEFVEKGKIPSFLSYGDYAFIFDIAQKVCGLKIPANHVAFEIIYAFLTRSTDDYTKQFRYTDMKKDPMFLRLSDIAHASTSNTAKLISSYLSDSMNAAIVNESENESKLEELLRQ